MSTKDHFRTVYADGRVLGTKVDIHARYSTKPIDLHEIITARYCQPPDCSILDIGCGTGHFLQHLTAAGHTGPLTGLDLVRPDIPDSGGTRYLAGDAESLPLPEGGCDVVTCLHTLSHIGDLPAAMGEAARVLRSGGVYVATANSLSSYPHVDRYRRRVHQLLGWGHARFTTTAVNAENLDQILSRYWSAVTVEYLDGELAIPTEEFPAYFAANIPTWERTPTRAEHTQILHWVSGWAHLDQHDGHLIEPKRVALAVCAPG